MAWLGRVAVAAVRLVARGAVVPTLPGAKRPDGRTLDLAVHLGPGPGRRGGARPAHRRHARSGHRPAPTADSRTVTLDMLGAVVDAIVREAAGTPRAPGPPAPPSTTAAVAEAVVTRLDGSTFVAPVAAGAEVSKRLDRWAKPVTGPLTATAGGPARSARLGQRLVPLGARPGRRGRRCCPSRRPSPTARPPSPSSTSWSALERILPALLRPGASAAARCT